MNSTVWQLLIDDRQWGATVRLFKSKESAEQALYEFVKKTWDDLDLQSNGTLGSIPNNPQKAVHRYFEWFHGYMDEGDYEIKQVQIFD